MPIQDTITKTIHRTLKTAQLIDLFWERWVVHGIDSDDLTPVKPHLKNLEGWLQSWETLAEEKVEKASFCGKNGLVNRSEYLYRQASLYYNLNYWIYPERSIEKQQWYHQCLKYMYIADSLSEFNTEYESISIDGIPCAGRIRIPSEPKGCILIINPIDSSKEELFIYEMEFLENGYVTLSFDGPGQGETYTLNGLIGSGTRWETFIMKVINYSRERFPQLPIYLFGTSLGATWVLLGSSHPEVKKAVAVSPAVALNKMNMPHYFEKRMSIACDLGPDQKTIPDFKTIHYQCPILVFHGNKDMMVTNDEMYELFQQLSTEKTLHEYKEEGHCCNNKLDEIRKISLKWFSDDF
ncbi:alpha/beta hydrolase [Neobacillus sp. PS3-34]|uniref:alpha/beta hydrolase n=1 Tax=Neobacillus sp. PS3-34 TaxID=3070678 RepID=UPI0027DFE2BE|nr:alpha/beta hydrolase [Neobacillus sp. PS3-34]WML50531.1 alpha/beta hydrolase [Neobacillus sp. PS3-34]